MSCDATQNRLLVLVHNEPLPVDVAQHLESCERCQRFQVRVQILDRELRSLPAPSSETRKAAFLDELTALGPVVRTRPSTLSQSHGFDWSRWAHRAWKPTLSTAAAALIGLGIWSLMPDHGKVPEEIPGPRLELVQKLIRHQTALAQAKDPRARLNQLTELAADLRGEARGVSLAVTTNEEMRTLSRMFDQVVKEGILPQAKDLSRQAPLSERRATLGRAAEELAVASNELATMPAATPAQEYLARMAETARLAQSELYRLAKEGV